MVWQRLAIFVLVNLGKLVVALQEIGLDARLPKDSDEFERLFLPVSTEVSLLDNKPGRMYLYNLHFYGAKLVHEFLSLKGFVGYVSQMGKDGKERAKNIK